MQNPILDQKRRTLRDRIALIVMTSLALTCLVFGVAGYFRLIAIEPFDLAKRWCVISMRRGYLTWTFSSEGKPPLSLIFPWNEKNEYDQINVLRHNTTGQILLTKKRPADAPTSPNIQRIEDADVAASEIEQLARAVQYWMHDPDVLRADFQQGPCGFLFQVNLAIPFILFALYPLYRLARFVQHHRRLKQIGKCVRCGYDLTGNVSGVCPVCGTAIRDDCRRA